MHDIVIRGGTIMDGTGKCAFSGDVAIAEGRITGVGGKQGPARREIDATGLMITPGWVDVHTHYDGQAMWDPLLAPSSSRLSATARCLSLHLRMKALRRASISSGVVA